MENTKSVPTKKCTLGRLCVFDNWCVGFDVTYIISLVFEILIAI